jgi:predicted ester cyclase
VSTEENKVVIRRLIEEVYNEDDQNVLDELVAPDVFNHSAVPEYQRGIEGFRYVNKWVLTAVPDVHYAIEAMIAEGDMVSRHVQRHARGRALGYPPDGQEILGRARPLAPLGRRQAGGALGRQGRSRDATATGSSNVRAGTIGRN